MSFPARDTPTPGKTEPSRSWRIVTARSIAGPSGVSGSIVDAVRTTVRPWPAAGAVVGFEPEPPAIRNTATTTITTATAAADASVPERERQER